MDGTGYNSINKGGQFMEDGKNTPHLADSKGK
jgi:hypothetical protein